MFSFVSPAQICYRAVRLCCLTTLPGSSLHCIVFLSLPLPAYPAFSLAKLFNAKESFEGELSAIARQGSGSACRRCVRAGVRVVYSSFIFDKAKSLTGVFFFLGGGGSELLFAW